MKLNAYRVLSALGSGRDGVACLAESTRESDPVEIRVLQREFTDSGRGNWLAKRIKLAMLLDHPAALKIISAQLEHDPPFVVIEHRQAPSVGSWQFGQLAREEVIGLAVLLTDVLAAAHRIGLAHGRLAPSNLFGDTPGEVQLDCTGLECRGSDDIALPGIPAARLDAMRIAPDAFEDDVYQLGALLHYVATGSAALPAAQTAIRQEWEPEFVVAFDRLLAEMMNADPDARPAMSEINERITALRRSFPNRTRATSIGNYLIARPNAALNTLEQTIDDVVGPPAPVQLGRFRILEKLGEGGMGTVYRAEDVSDGTLAAVKVIRTDRATRPSVVKRLYKEARLLAEVNNPYVANLLEVNEDAGVHYLVMEFVSGRDLGKLIEEGGPMRERAAVSIMADVARALVRAHELGIIHRDIKPTNILMLEESLADAKALWATAASSIDDYAMPRPRVKLADFGLARQLEQSESLDITQAGATLGTPSYMAPEQTGNGSAISARSDVYSIGATLYHLLAGRPPFVGESIARVIAMHLHEAPMSLTRLNPRLSDAVCQVVARMLEKAPAARYANAAELLRDLEQLLRGEPTHIAAHPRSPDNSSGRVLTYEWEWDLDATPQQLWPLISNTERFNRAIGLPAVGYHTESSDSGRMRRFGRFRKLGIAAVWEEHPFEWIEGRRMGILREYSQGVLKWMTSVVELTPRGMGGTRLTHRIRVEPTGWLGRIAAGIEIGMKARRAADRVYQRIDATLTGKLGNPAWADPFEPPHRLPQAGRRRLDGLIDQLNHCDLDSHVVLRLAEYLSEAPAQELARIRPLELARRFALDPEQTIAACLHGARVGLLVLQWDILCPRCRISCSIQDTIRAIRDHANCEACNADFELDFANSVEMVFRVHPQIREVDAGQYCIGGPAHSPHVVAQVRVAPGERFELGLTLGEGSYRLRGPQLSYTVDFYVQAGIRESRCEFDLRKGPRSDFQRKLDAGAQLFVLTNSHPHELVARVERTLPANILTAARATSLPLFRQLFPGEILSPNQLISVSTLALVATDLEDAELLYRERGDAQAVAIIHEHFRILEEYTRAEGGALVKTIHNGMLIAFHDTVTAVNAALRLQQMLRERPNTRDLQLRVAVHRGPTIAATLNNNLDYFGNTVNEVLRLAQKAHAGAVLLTQAAAVDPQVVALLRNCTVEAMVVHDCSDSAPIVVHRVVLKPADLPSQAKQIKEVQGAGALSGG